jgi:hypothetical protein
MTASAIAVSNSAASGGRGDGASAFLILTCKQPRSESAPPTWNARPLKCSLDSPGRRPVGASPVSLTRSFRPARSPVGVRQGRAGRTSVARCHGRPTAPGSLGPRGLMARKVGKTSAMLKAQVPDAVRECPPQTVPDRTIGHAAGTLAEGLTRQTKAVKRVARSC